MQSSVQSDPGQRQRLSQFDAPSAGSGARLEIKHNGDGLVMATLGPISIALWKSKPTRLLFEIQRTELAKVVDAHRGTAEGRTSTGIPVYNVAMPLLARLYPNRPPYLIVELPLPAEPPPPAGPPTGTLAEPVIKSA